jgi:Mg/Co/Ni transporter MgtE
MRSSWMNLCPASASARDLEEPEQNAAVAEEIVSLRMSMCLEVDSEDVEELVEDHNAELTTEELRDLHMEQQQEVAEELSSEEEKVDSKGSIPTVGVLD